MPHSHAPVQLVPQLKRLDRHFGGSWSKLDIEDRARDWAKHLAAAPLASIAVAVDHLIEHHEGHYPKLAVVRRLALEHAHRTTPSVAPQSDRDPCNCCGEMPGWHRLARPRVIEEIERRRQAGIEVDIKADPHLTPIVERLVIRHREGYACSRFNKIHTFADGAADREESAA